MAINKNHLFDELEGIKCAVVETMVSEERVHFLKSLLEYNGYTVVVVPSPAPKATPKAAVQTEDASSEPDALSEAAPTYTIGVTDVMFNPTNALFGRFLKSKDGQVVTPAYWQQKETILDEEKPYYIR